MCGSERECATYKTLTLIHQAGDFNEGSYASTEDHQQVKLSIAENSIKTKFARSSIILNYVMNIRNVTMAT